MTILDKIAMSRVDLTAIVTEMEMGMEMEMPGVLKVRIMMAIMAIAHRNCLFFLVLLTQHQSNVHF